jgi:hypothetical protein
MIAESRIEAVTGEFSNKEEEVPRDTLLIIYGEVCRSYHAIDDFRTKLLGILPITSLVGILLLGRDNLFLGGDAASRKLVGFGSFFAAAFTLALFLFEIRGILRCHHLIQRGIELEKKLRVNGQFSVCAHQRDRENSVASEKIFNAKVAACAMYSLVFSAWLFLALKFTFGIHLIGCGLTATLIGAIIAVGAHKLVSKRIAA